MSDPASPPAKRPRPDDQEIVRSSEIWHRDGSLVLQAEGKQFRVHWGVLSVHSAFFRDMEGIPQPPDEPKIEGCPVIELSDSAQDLEVVLKSLYNPLFFTQKALPLSDIAAHIRLGRKYDLKDLLPTMIERLVHENPRTLEAHNMLKNPHTGKYAPTHIQPYKAMWIDILTLARENNIFSVLPCAYMRVVMCHSQTVLFDGVDRPDGTRATLSPSDQRLCTLARLEISKAQWNVGNTFGWLARLALNPNPGDCLSYSDCMGRKAGFFHAHVIKGSLAPFASIPHLMDSFHLCEVCTADARLKMTEGQQKMWDMLPSFFGLPSWADLKDDI
ncbi:hypothetical protein FB45DRAFT_778846 [Roridomyces roridus]|uniref:BTB domain-containing protein n=1 Tax=Roridomyces roridus TaxID=1738132 RepID=A0AAD7CII8_9AGAR|nr:hypothetical protein FB45DRAFT_778846 [Roridomyces roridus]